MAGKRCGKLSPLSLLLQEFNSTQVRLTRENNLMQKRLDRQARKQRAVKLRKLADRAQRAHELAVSDASFDASSQVVQMLELPRAASLSRMSEMSPGLSPGSALSGSGQRFSLADRWRNNDVRLNSFGNSQMISGELVRQLTSDQGRTRRQMSLLDTVLAAIRKIRVPWNPNSTARLVWDFLGLFLISWDVIFIPFELAFDPAATTFTTTVGWIILLYWSGDVVMSNLVGFYEQGELIMNQRRIIFRYLRTWFLIDLLVLGPDWFLRVLATTGEAGDLRMVNETSADEGEMEDVANALRSLRVLRVVRLLRLLKVQRLMNLVYDILDSEYIFILFTLLKLTCLITVMNHVIACMWYGVGYMTMQNGELNWLENSGANASRVIDGSMMYQYTTALHWSLTQFTPASMDSVARNVPERIVSIVVVFFALIGFSSIVGSVTNSVAQLQALHGNSRRQFWLLRKYLNEKGIWNPTRARLFAFLEHEVERRRQDVKAEDVRLLQLLSSPLQNLLAYELHRGPMKGHPFFGLLEAEMQPVMYQVCHKALRFRHYAAEDTCFTEAEGGKFMWLITEGTFTYIKGGQRHTLSQGAWLAEPVLWTSWWHRGQLEGKSTSGELATVSPSALATCCKSHPRPWHYARKYGIKFVKALQGLHTSHLSDLDAVDQEDLLLMAAESDDPDI